jgi:osmoprotectant transport system ATP-binding protein
MLVERMWMDQIIHGINMITLQHATKSYDNGKTFNVYDLNLNIQTGETLVILGSSGSGKTTTLKMINRLIDPTSGDIFIDDKNILSLDAIQLRRSIGYVFQSIGLFPHLTIEENIAIVLRLIGKPRTVQRERAAELLQLVNLDPTVYAKRFPIELSGGQQQRVGVARALAADPNILLMDEPFGALDAITRNALQNELIHWKKTFNKTIVFVTHDITEAVRIGDRIAIMHEGKLEQIDTYANIMVQPSSQFVKQLLANHKE